MIIWFRRPCIKGGNDRSFCFTLLTDDGSVYAVRDTRGFRPLVLGHIEETNTYMISSESCAIDTVGVNFLEISNLENC